MIGFGNFLYLKCKTDRLVFTSLEDKPGQIIRVFAIVLLCLSSFACGCGGGSSTSASGPQIAITSGNWDFAASSNSGASFQIGGDFDQSGSTISGSLRIFNSTCIDSGTIIPISGTVSGQTITVTSANIASQVITASVNGSASALSGTYSITGTGCASGDKGTLSGVFVPSVTGTWKGTFTSKAAGNPQIGVTVTLTEGAAGSGGFPGLFGFTGTVAYTGSSCFTTGNLTSGSLIVGRHVQVVSTNNDGSQIMFIGTLTNPSTATQASGMYNVFGGACGGDSGTGSLTKQ